MIRHAVSPAFHLSLAVLLVLGSGLPARAQEVVTDSLAMDWSRFPSTASCRATSSCSTSGRGRTRRRTTRVEQLVRPDGRITVYPIGDVVAAGLTPMELQRSADQRCCPPTCARPA